MLSELIFFNKDILDPSTGLPLVNHQIAKVGITRITDVSYSVVPGPLTNAAVHELLSGTVSLKKTYRFMGRLRSSLPDEWSRLLNSDETSKLSAEHSSFRIDDPTTKEKIPTTKMMTKKIYDILIQQADEGTSANMIFHIPSIANQYGKPLPMTIFLKTNTVTYTGAFYTELYR